MGIMNLFNRKKTKEHYALYALHEQFANGTMSSQDYCFALSQHIIDAFFSKDALALMKKYNVDILNVDESLRTKFAIEDLRILEQECGKASTCSAQLLKTVKERMKQKDSAPDHFSCRYKGVEIISSQEWSKIYQSTDGAPISLTTEVDTLWELFCIRADILKLNVPLIVNKYRDMVNAQASFECER